MKKKFILSLVLMLFVLTGCTTYHASNKINKNRTMDFDLLYGEKNDSGQPASYRNSVTTDLEEETSVIGYAISTVTEGDNSYSKITGSISLIDDFCTNNSNYVYDIGDYLDRRYFSLNAESFYTLNSQDNGLFYCERNGNKTIYTVHFKYRYKTMTSQAAGQDKWVYPDTLEEGSSKEDYYDTADISYSIDLSGINIISNDADNNNNGVLTWNINPREIKYMNFSFSLDTYDIYFNENEVTSPLVMTPGEEFIFSVDNSKLTNGKVVYVHDKSNNKLDYTLDSNQFYHVTMPMDSDIYIKIVNPDEIINTNPSTFNILSIYYSSFILLLGITGILLIKKYTKRKEELL